MKRIFCVAAVFGCLLGSLANAQVNCLVATAEPHGDGWYFHDWFGWFHDEGQGWIYHTEHGLQYVSGESAESFYLYDMGIGSWFWSSGGYYPYLYKFGKNDGWFWYYCGCEPGNRWFNNLGTGRDVFEQAMGIPLAYALVLPGTFTIGSPTTERGRLSHPNETQHQVTLTRAFAMSPTEITYSQYYHVHKQAADFGYTDLSPGYYDPVTDPHGIHPVVALNWDDVIKWLNLKSEIEGRVPVYYSTADFSPGSVIRTGLLKVYANFDADGFRLPTSAEWEYACRAGTTTAFYTGDITYTASSPPDPNLVRAGWYYANGGEGTMPVALKEPNAWGLYDMHGNVWEWCWDRFEEYTTAPQVNPVGADKGDGRIVRGGSFWASAAWCRSACRFDAPSDIIAGDLGFRPVATWAP